MMEFKPKPLTPRQELFVAEYPVDWNGKQAAIRAGFSPRTARQIACRLLTYPHIAARINAARELTEQRAEEVKMLREKAEATEPLISSKLAATILNVRYWTLIHLARSGTVPAIKLGSRWKFRASTLNRWIEEQMSNGD